MSTTFQYKAFDQTGNIVTGTVEAASSDEVATRLRIQGLFPSSVEPVKERRSLFGSFQRVKRMPANQLAVLSRQLAIMLETGMPVTEALRILAGQQLDAGAKNALLETLREVSGGRSLADSLKNHGNVFPDMFLDMVEVGEYSGNLAEILNRMADFYERDAKLRGDIKQALTYPTVIITFALVAIGVVMFVVLPSFAGMFAEFGVELPFITRMVIALRDFMLEYILFVMAAFVLIAFGIRAFVRSDRGRMMLDTLVLRLPTVGELVTKVIFTRFARTLSLLFTSGISMVEALESCKRVVGNRAVAKDIELSRAGVQRGQGVSDPLRHGARFFPPMLVEMMAVGEETGSLDKVLNQVADFYDVEVEQSVKGLTAIIEPVIMVMLGGIILLIMMSVFVPMFSMVDVIQ